jgi:hypothetical protein
MVYYQVMIFLHAAGVKRKHYTVLQSVYPSLVKLFLLCAEIRVLGIFSNFSTPSYKSATVVVPFFSIKELFPQLHQTSFRFNHRKKRVHLCYCCIVIPACTVLLFYCNHLIDLYSHMVISYLYNNFRV